MRNTEVFLSFCNMLKKLYEICIRFVSKYGRIFTLLFLLLATSPYIWIQINYFTPAYQEVDPDGYLILAKRMAKFKPLAIKDNDPFMYQSHVWVENSRGEIAPKFAPGYPALMSIAYNIGGDRAMFIVSPIMGFLGLIGCYFLFRLWMSRIAATAGVLLIAANTMFLVYSGYLLTHASNTCFVVWGMSFIWRWLRDNNTMSGLFGGLILGASMTIRHTSVLMVSVLIAAILIKLWRHYNNGKPYNEILKPVLVLFGAYCVFPFILMVYNYAVFESPFVTGYGLSQEQGAFKLASISKNARMLASGLNTEGLFLLFPLGIAGILLSGSMGDSIMQILWVLPVYLLYTSYYWAFGNMAYYRFLIVTFPCFIGAACALLDTVKNSNIRKIFTFIIIVSMIFFVQKDFMKGRLKGTLADLPSQSLAYSAEIMADQLEDDAVIFSQRPVFCYIGTVENFRFYDLNIFTSAYGNSAFKEGVQPKRQPVRNKRFREFYSKLTDENLQEKKQDLIDKFLENGRQVIYFIPESVAVAEKKQIWNNYRWILLNEIEVYTSNDKNSKALWKLYEIVIAKKSISLNFHSCKSRNDSVK
ncbi:hypothetical protein GF312_17710 [Candidatus Poribacteria bacterium]|nr:hypothetical protein [Candidatus Poribacteria bacterium]